MTALIAHQFLTQSAPSAFEIIPRDPTLENGKFFHLLNAGILSAEVLPERGRQENRAVDLEPIDHGFEGLVRCHAAKLLDP